MIVALIICLTIVIVALLFAIEDWHEKSLEHKIALQKMKYEQEKSDRDFIYAHKDIHTYSPNCHKKITVPYNDN